ncbi:MEDS domain-containing protein [Actinoplanes sp. CA-030573]|uniref:MEDS domain-containing protein n=1 Tax=Actinoplanes sp. CA-030573 TaxID=3239898 RepID=UPI003D92FA17
MTDAPVDLCTLAPGTHLIALYRSEAEMARTAAAFIAAGLEAGDRVLYVVDERPPPSVRATLAADDTNAEAATVAGQFSVCRFADVYGLPYGPDRRAAADGFHATAELARSDGFPGLRIVTEVGQTQALGPFGEVLAWERLTTRLHQEEGVTSVCQYDQRYFNGEHVRLLAAEHAGAAPDRVAPPRASFRATPPGLRITGELDGTNLDGCARVVEARLAAIPRLVIDVGGVTFLDIGTFRRLYAIADRLPAGGRITLAHVSPELHRMIGILGWRHPNLGIDPPVEDSSLGTEVV